MSAAPGISVRIATIARRHEIFGDSNNHVVAVAGYAATSEAGGVISHIAEVVFMVLVILVALVTLAVVMVLVMAMLVMVLVLMSAYVAKDVFDDFGALVKLMFVLVLKWSCCSCRRQTVDGVDAGGDAGDIPKSSSCRACESRTITWNWLCRCANKDADCGNRIRE